MNPFSRDLGNNNVLCIRPKPLHEVVTMPSRLNRSEGRRSALDRGAVVRMPARLPRGEHRSPVVLTMPSRSSRAQQHASVVEMPSRFEDTGETLESHAAANWRKPVDTHLSARLTLSDGLRMTLVALFALLGWPRPTHGNDPGAAAARPLKLELLNVISNLRIPEASLAVRRAQHQGALALPLADDSVVARAA